MKAGTITVGIGVVVIATVMVLYFWPSPIGRGCPQLLLTAEQMRDGTRTAAEIQAAGEAGYERHSCLTRQINARLQPALPEQLSFLDALLKAVFVSDDMKRFSEESGPAFEAWRASWPDESRDGSD